METTIKNGKWLHPHFSDAQMEQIRSKAEWNYNRFIFIQIICQTTCYNYKCQIIDKSKKVYDQIYQAGKENGIFFICKTVVCLIAENILYI